MTTTNQTIIGRWSVVEQQKRVRDEWIEKYDFEPGNWEISFHPNGRLNIEFRMPGSPQEFCNGSWAHDPLCHHRPLRPRAPQTEVGLKAIGFLKIFGN